MIKPDDPRELAEILLNRSICSVQVAAVIADRHGILAWGWNFVGGGYGKHAETHAISRANRKRLEGATIYVASQRKRNGKMVTSKPCQNCQNSINLNEIAHVCWRDADGRWIYE